MKRTYALCAAFFLLFCTIGLLRGSTALASVTAAPLQPAPLPQAAEAEGCLTCHAGIESIRPEESAMMKDIKARGECTICHGGDPAVTDDADAAHKGAPASVPFADFIPDPGSMAVANQTCGQCHENYADALERSLMNTNAGTIQGNLWSWGVAEDQATHYGNYAVEGSQLLFGSFFYKDYMLQLSNAYPDQFPTALAMAPNPTIEEIQEHPAMAAFTYQRQQCQQCHLGVQGNQVRGEYRGLGCSSCHMPYSAAGFYEGGDPTIPKDEPGHILVHEMQGTREARNGIPTESCTTCHNQSKRTGTNYQGLMASPYSGPAFADGTTQTGDRQLHNQSYLYIKEDLHHEQQSRPENPAGGLLCQDCHTSLEVHGDGLIPGTTLAQVEIECADCHGTPTAYPWELPLGYGEEFAALAEQRPTDPRGLGSLLDLLSQDGTLYDMEEGYLLTARGNPFGNVVLTAENKVVVHSDTGKDFFVPLLKTIAEEGSWSTPDGEVAMVQVQAHMDKLECYACHSDWAPQEYGCAVNVNYGVDADGQALTATDWIASGNAPLPDGSHELIQSPGSVTQSPAYLRWEAPILGVNGEGRVSPLIPGCQTVFTVIGPDGKPLTTNAIGRTPPGVEGGGDAGQRTLTMMPVQPHTAGRQARTCESCHSDPKALGYGIEGGRFLRGYTEERTIDLKDADGKLLPSQSQPQLAAIPDLPMDWSQIVDPTTGEQLMTVGTNWPDDGPLSADQRTRMERTGLCMGCHQNMADSAFWTDQVIAKFGQAISNDEHIQVMNAVIQAAVAAPSAQAAPALTTGTPLTERVPVTASGAVTGVMTATVPVTESNAVTATPVAVAEGRTEEAEVRIIDAEVRAAAAVATTSAIEARLAESVTQATTLQDQLTAAETALTQAQSADQPGLPTTSGMTLWVLVALALGVVTGSGAIYFTGRRE
ncbi:MAG: cytochrome C [Caldilinea sp. CFX5]|nr:cytochrome C [Caldilinea sp. CFX5]